MRKGASRIRADERILRQGDFVETVLKAAQENLDRQPLIRPQGYDFDWLVDRVLGLFGGTFNELLPGGKQRRTVQARSLLCCCGNTRTRDERGRDIEKTVDRVLDGKRIHYGRPANRRKTRVEASGQGYRIIRESEEPLTPRAFIDSLVRRCRG